MSHYDLNRMGWQQFEQMVQALALCELGNGVRLFGAGKDGRREATFRGKVNFPVSSGRELWDGYGVIQVKYRDQPKNTTADWKWFLDQVRSELDKWVSKIPPDGTLDPKKFPKYFIFASNVALSGTEDTGGIDLFDALLESYKRKLGVAGWFAWDYSQIRGLLDKHPSVRQTYLEQITGGDFFAQLESLLPGPMVLTVKALAVHAATELTTRQWARIGDSGYGDSSKLRLSAIGIDLPCTHLPRTMDEGRSRATYVGQVATVLANEICRPGGGGPGAKGIVVIGGPGQGKSTIAQLIAHSYRVAFIRDAEPGSLGPKTNEALAVMGDRLREQSFPAPTRRRWPIFIDLAAFGTYAANREGAISLLAYIAETIRVAGVPITSPALLQWIAAWPVLLILDGLDEVPDARARTRLIDSISAFVTEVSSVNGDLFVIATTRPQGYSDEFSDALNMSVAYLTEFSETQALEYAEALIALRSDEDPEQAAQVTERLIVAVHQRLTQRLMTTPLQVTIMAALAERAVDLPTTRYELFDAYYSTIYDREVGKTTAFKKLRKLRSHIDFLHEQAGLGLQIRNERPAASDQLLSRSELSRMLNKRLKVAGFDIQKVKSTTNELLKLASERLVLLVSPDGKMHGFEVRSIQEYMAARALTEGPDDLVLGRLKVLAPAAHWRNTWLLAAGRLLEMREHLGPNLVELVREFDASSDESRAVMAGAGLAADLYTDGLAFDFPALRTSILVSALELFSDTAQSSSFIMSEVVAISLSDPEYESVLLSTLHGISSRSTSNLATKLFSEYRLSPDPIGSQAKKALGAGHTYSKPESRAAGARSFVLSSYIESLSLSVDPDDEIAAFARLLAEHVPTEETSDSRIGDELPTTSLEVFGALESFDVRRALARTVHTIRVREPDVAHYGVLLLRYRAARRLRGDELPDPDALARD